MLERGAGRVQQGDLGDLDRRRKRCVAGLTEGLQRTLWDLAEAVSEEVEQVCADEDLALRISNYILVQLIRRHVRNMEIVGTVPECALFE